MKKLTKELVLEQFKKIHGDLYDYSKFEYESSDIKSLIICKNHGEFTLTPAKHKYGRG